MQLKLDARKLKMMDDLGKMEEIHKENLSKVIKAIIEDGTITAYADKCGVSRATLSKLINKRKDVPPKPDLLRKIASTSKQPAIYPLLMVVVGYVTLDMLFNSVKGGIIC